MNLVPKRLISNGVRLLYPARFKSGYLQSGKSRLNKAKIGKPEPPGGASTRLEGIFKQASADEFPPFLVASLLRFTSSSAFSLMRLFRSPDEASSFVMNCYVKPF